MTSIIFIAAIFKTYGQLKVFVNRYRCENGRPYSVKKQRKKKKIPTTSGMETTNFLNGFYNAENPILNKITWEAIFSQKIFFCYD